MASLRTVRARVDEPTFEALCALVPEGSTLAAEVRKILMQHVARINRPVPTKAQMERLVTWCTENGYPAEELGITTRSGLMAWASEKGFMP